MNPPATKLLGRRVSEVAATAVPIQSLAHDACADDGYPSYRLGSLREAEQGGHRERYLNLPATSSRRVLKRPIPARSSALASATTGLYAQFWQTLLDEG